MRRERVPAVYIMASGFHGTIYVGVTSDLLARIHQHRNGTFRGFTDRYGCKRLVVRSCWTYADEREQMVRFTSRLEYCRIEFTSKS